MAARPVPYGYPLRADRYPPDPLPRLQQAAAWVPAALPRYLIGYLLATRRGLIGYLCPFDRVPAALPPLFWPAIWPP